MITLDLPAKTATRPKPKAQYSGAVHNRLTADWFAVILSADRETRGTLKTLRARSRQLFRDNAHAAGLANALEDNVIGPDGIGVNPRMQTSAGRFLKKANLDAWATFQRWADPLVCSADGQNSWPELQRLALRTWVVDGEAFVRRLPGFDNAFAYAVQLLDADLLDESFEVLAGPRNNQITQGVEIDRFGRPVAYHFWTQHPSDPAFRRDRERVPAEDVIHLFTQLRTGQRRGLPLLTPALLALKMVDGYTEAEITAARMAAAQSGFFVALGEDAERAGMSYDSEKAAIPIEYEAEPGSSTQLPPGWQFQKWDPSHPNGNFPDFQKTMLRMISRAVGISYITLSGDLSDTSYSSGRVGLIAERDRYKAIQKWFGSKLIVPIYRDVLRYASLAGELDLPRSEAVRWDACILEPRGWTWVDPKNDAMATRMSLADALTSPQRVCAAQGIDYEDILDELKEAAEMRKSRGLEDPTYGEVEPAEDTPDTPKPYTNGNGSSANGHNRLALADLVTLERL